MPVLLGSASQTKSQPSVVGRGRDPRHLREHGNSGGPWWQAALVPRQALAELVDSSLGHAVADHPWKKGENSPVTIGHQRQRHCNSKDVQSPEPLCSLQFSQQLLWACRQDSRPAVRDSGKGPGLETQRGPLTRTLWRTEQLQMLGPVIPCVMGTANANSDLHLLTQLH